MVVKFKSYTCEFYYVKVKKISKNIKATKSLLESLLNMFNDFRLIKLIQLLNVKITLNLTIFNIIYLQYNFALL